MNTQQKARFAEALARLCDDADLLCSMASLVSADADGVLDELREHLRRGDVAESARSAHKLKGMLSTFETGSPITELQELIDTARRGDGAACRRQFASLEGKVETLLTEIGQLQPTIA